MKKLWINKKAIFSIALAGSIMMGAHACGNTNDNTNDSEDNLSIQTTVVIDTEDNLNVQTTDEVSDNTIYVDKNNQMISYETLNDSEYKNIEGDNRYTILPGASIYYTNGFNIVDDEIVRDLFMVNVIKTNDTYSYCLFPNNTYGYVNNNSLIKCANLSNGEYIMVENNKDDILSANAYLYNKNGLYIGYVNENEICKVIATNGEYTLINLSDGREGYVLNRSLTNNHKQINGYGYIRQGKVVYRDTNFTSAAYTVCEDLTTEVLYMNEKYAAIFDSDINDIFYIRPEDLDDDFIIVDLDTQRIDCYLDYQLAGSWGTRSGKDSSPTHAGAFDIDWKVEDFEFENYPGSHARYWIPINEYDEGIHDLMGDDEQNYGNQAYHQYGSHGCIRVPVAASEFVYNNYEVGDMVLVRKK